MRLGLAVCVAVTSAMLTACQGPLPATLEFVDQSPLQPKLGEITTLRFRAIDSAFGQRLSLRRSRSKVWRSPSS